MIPKTLRERRGQLFVITTPAHPFGGQLFAITEPADQPAAKFGPAELVSQLAPRSRAQALGVRPIR